MGTNQKVTKKVKQERRREAEERERINQAKKEASDKTKRVFTVIICVILVLALGIPTVALSVLSFS